MLTVIIGAGASYDSESSRTPVSTSSYNESARPPLAQELFDERFGAYVARFPACGPVVRRLRQAIEDGQQVESVLSSFQAEGASYPQRNNQLMAIRYYLQAVISDTCESWYRQNDTITNYSALVDRLNEWSVRNRLQVGYVTFNYDILLELALRSIGRRFVTMDDYIGLGMGPMCRVIKPHGSCDWMRIATRPLEPGRGWTSGEIRYADAGTVIDMTEKILETNEIWPAAKARTFREGEVGVPAIAIPTDAKHEFVCPQSHIDALREMLRVTETVLIIGWRASEPHFLTELREHIRPGVTCFVANGSDADGGLAMNALQTAGVNQFTFRPLGGPGFSDLIESDALQTVLDSANRPI